MAPQVPFVIAEAGVNHNGSLGRARAMISAAAAAGADAVKFQAFDPDTLVSSQAKTAEYQKVNTGVTSQAELLRPLTLDMDAFAFLAADCRTAGLEFLCTAFDPSLTAPLLALGMTRIKVPSGELTNQPALEYWGSLGVPVLLSTGMATLEEVLAACNTLRRAGCRDITILHCTSLYPAPVETANLRAILTLREATGLAIGYSDHTLGDTVAIAATALGATVIEKHFTLDRNLPGPDHAASLLPSELTTMVSRLRETAVSLGDGIKRPAHAELDTAVAVRRSWHAVRSLAAGTLLCAGDLALKRPAIGLAPASSPVGKRLRQAVAADAPIMAADIE